MKFENQYKMYGFFNLLADLSAYTLFFRPMVHVFVLCSLPLLTHTEAMSFKTPALFYGFGNIYDCAFCDFKYVILEVV